MQIDHVPDDVRTVVVPYLSTRNVESWPTNINCGGYVRLFRQLPRFHWNHLAFDRNAFEAFKSSVLRSLTVFKERIEGYFPTMEQSGLRVFTVETPNRIVADDFHYEVYSDFNLVRPIEQALWDVQVICEFDRDTDNSLDSTFPPHVQVQRKMNRIEHLKGCCSLIVSTKKKLRRFYEVYPEFLRLVEEYATHRDLARFRHDARDRHIAPFGLRASPNFFMSMRIESFLPLINQYRNQYEVECQYLTTSVLQPIRL